MDKIRKTKKTSEYGRQLKEKQELKKIYGIREGQMRNYVERATKMGGNAAENILILLELRLDNVLFRSGFAKTRPQARQYASHGLFGVNQRKTTVPSIELKIGDKISPRKSEQFKEQKITSNSWLEAKDSAKEVEIKKYPTRENIDTPVDENIIIQFYSR